MPSRLEESTKTARNIGIGCLIVVVAVLLFNFIAGLLEKPPEPLNPYPTSAANGYGSIPEFNLDSLPLAENSSPEYKIETQDGALPQLQSIVNVYKTKTPYQSLTAQDDAIRIADSLNFKGDLKVLTSTELKWTLGARTLIINKLYKTVRLETDYKKDERANQSHEILPDSSPYINAAQSYLTKAKLLPERYISNGSSSATYLKLNSNHEFEQAESAQDADFVRVDFFKQIEMVPVIALEDSSEETQAEIESYRLFTNIHTDNPYEGLIYIILGGTRGVKDIYELSYTDWVLDRKSTYNLMTVSDAWENIKNGSGYLKSLYDNTKNPFETYLPLNVESFLLTNVEIIYYTPKVYTDYISPIYKFTGIAKLENGLDADFTYYHSTLAPIGG